MKDIAFACLYLSYRSALEPFSDAERGRILFAMIDYAATGQDPQLKGNERFIWPFLKGQIDRDKEDYRRRCETSRKNGTKGGRPKKAKETQGLPQEPEKANNKENATDTDKAKDNTTAIDNATASESAADTPSPAGAGSHTFVPPDAKMVQAYCIKMGYNIDPERFVDYYSALGWRMGNAPVRDWKALVRTWGKNEQTPTYQPPMSPLARAAARYGPIGVEL